MWLVLILLVALALPGAAWLACRASSPATGRGAPRACLLPMAGLAALAVGTGALLEHELQVGARLGPWLAGAGPVQAMAEPSANDPGLIRYLASARPLGPAPAAGATDAASRREQRRASLAAIFGFAATGAAPVVAGYREHADGALLASSLAVRSRDGSWIPVVVMRPREARPLGAIIVVPGHVRAGESGLRQLTGTADSYQHRAARALAAAGFLTLSLELRGFGSLGPPRHPEHEQVAYNALLAGTFYKALVIQDVGAALEYLLTRGDVAAERIGITGASLGGEIAVAYAALDTRVRAIAFHSYGGSVGNFRGATGGSRPHYCHLIPGSGTRFSQEDVFQLLAPRPTQGLRGDGQPFRNPAFGRALAAAWDDAGAPGALRLGNAPGGHEYFVEQAVDFFRAVFPTPP